MNDVPSAGDDTATLQEDGEVTLALLSNDVDLDGWSVVKKQTPGGPEGFDSETKPWSVPI